MTNNLLSVIVLAGVVGTFVYYAPEPRGIASRPPPVTPTIVAPTVVASTVVAPTTVASTTISSHQHPIPLVRGQRALPASGADPAARTNQAEPEDASNRTAAKAAIEADGYRGVTVLGKGADGTWRAKAYRGKTEVRLTVDGTGRVSTD